MNQNVKKNTLAELGLAGTYVGIENRVSELIVKLPDLSPVTIDGRFFYLTFRGKSSTIQEFVDFLYPKIIPFCIPRSKRNQNLQKFNETNDDRYYLELADKARNLFIKASKTLKRSGEPGELILFTLLEAFFDAPQIACKMYLKTSENMPVHGSDSIHIKYDVVTRELSLLWGESKLYQSLASSLNEICGSIAQFNSIKDGRSPRERDIDIIKDHTNIEDPNALSAFLDYFDPYTPQINKRTEIFCCLSGFDFNVYKNFSDKKSSEIETFFKEKYMACVSKACVQFKDKIIESGIGHLEFIFILLPFKSVAEFRRLFFAKLGYSPDE